MGIFKKYIQVKTVGIREISRRKISEKKRNATLSEIVD